MGRPVKKPKIVISLVDMDSIDYENGVKLYGLIKEIDKIVHVECKINGGIISMAKLMINGL
jgi:hypothetical protein